MRLKYQLFLTLLAASATLIVVMLLIHSWSFSRGFLNYQNNTAKARLQALSIRLAERYEQEGNWDWASRRNLDEPLRRSRDRGGPRKPKRERSGSDPKRPPPPGSSNRSWPKLLLADSDKQLLVGRVRDQDVVFWEEVRVKDQLVGHIGFEKLKRTGSVFEQAFERQQKKSFLFSSIALALLSGLLAIPLAARIVKPLLSVNEAVSEVSQGNYAHRVPDTRRDELGDLSRSVNQLGESLEQNRTSRQRWIAEISHELRTPLAVLRGELEALQDGVRDLDPDSVDSLHSEVLQLSVLVDDLHMLSMSDLGALDYVMAPVSFSEVIAECLKASQPLIESSSLAVVTDIAGEDTIVEADEKRLRQMVGNLLHNSLKYTDPNGHKDARIEIKLSTEQIEGKPVIVLLWSDTAPGVEPDMLDKLFEPLYRGEASRNRETGGAGLGLAIVERIVAAHAGRVSASAAGIGGLCVRIELPVQQGTTS